MVKQLGKVAVLYGGRSAEREVSLMSGQGVHAALLSRGVDAHLFDTASKPLSDLVSEGFDRVFITLHGRFGEDGTMQGALELLQIPYTGSGHQACAIAMDKITTKRLWQQDGLPTPHCRVLADEADLDGLVQELGLPMILKAPNEGSTLGLYQVQSAPDLAQAYANARQFDRLVLAEQFIRGRELTVAILGEGQDAQALPVIEIVAPGGQYDYEHKYFSDDTQYLCPAPLSDVVARKVMDLARDAYLSIGCSGWGRVDIMLDGNEQPWLLEVNTSPGMTSHSLVPMAAKAVGVSYAELCERILAQASCKVSPTPSSVSTGVKE
ncbi:D-alanine--D-alanine ligase [Orrella marina]|uniref:D-alanine--D-alanine ligase n=1 Tax=Orrella marina TaxID=2163011 RepID=A0A2R4XPR0_9BURK|nr:D-alanine--D-alanine ligase [Orrella marina]AWB35792.1 D-alanine--D-alanine ligase [Orrella marina]